MTEENKDKKIEDSTLREFSENPFDVDSRRPEDVVRLFYIHDVPIIPVISKRGVLIGILRKESVISELSDIERVEKLKIDEFITRLAVKMNFDDLLQYGKIREFVVINIFGEVQGTWSRLQLFASCDSGKISSHDEVKKQQEDQLLEWMIYHILEHIPRALYALNENGKTVFYNSLFEEIYEEKLKSEVDLSHAEKLFTDPSINELFSSFNEDELFFYNTELDVFYEKIPLMNNGRRVGFLIFCEKNAPQSRELRIPGVDLRDKSLTEMLEELERFFIVTTLKECRSLDKSAERLKITRQSLNSKIKKYNIDLEKT